MSITSNTDDTLGFPLLDIPPGATLTVVYNAVLANDVVAGSIHNNNVTANYDSLIAGGGRNNAGSNDDDDGNLDNYGESDSAPLTIDSSIAIQKSLNASHVNNDFTIGDLITFDLRIDIIEGTTRNVIITDALPSGLDFEGPARIVAGGHISYAGSGVVVEAPSGTLTIDMGNVTNSPDGNTNNDFFIVEIDARVVNISGNISGAMWTNSASLTTNVGPAGPDTQIIDIVEPNLMINKTVNTASPSLGDFVTFTITVSHSSSSSDAYDVVLTDMIPNGLTYVLGSHTGDGSVSEIDPNIPVFNLGTITQVDGSKSFTFRCQVDLDATVGTAITNTINAVYDNQSGTPSLEREYTASGSEDVTPVTSAEIDVVKTVDIVVDGGNIGIAYTGDTLEYTIVLTNGPTAVTNVVFDDLIPNNTTYVASSLATAPNGTVIDASAPNLQVTLANMSPFAVETITFRVTINGGTPFGAVISNQAFVDSNESVPEPSDDDGIDSNGDQSTDITVGGPSSINNGLYVQKLVDWISDTDASDDITAGDTVHYTLIIENQGNEALTGVNITDTLPAGLTFVGASEVITGAGNNITVIGDALSINIPMLNIGNSQSASFEVTVDAFAPMSNIYVNQAVIDSDQTNPSTSDNNGDASDGNQPTRFVAVNGMAGAADIDVEKRWSHALDLDGDGLVDPGETIAYTITVLNTGSAMATDVRLSDTIPANTTLVNGSVSTSAGVVVTEDPVNINVGNLNPGGLVTIQFSVTIDGGTPDGSIVPNQATVVGNGGINEPSDDNGDDSDGKNPTLTTIDTGGGSGSPTGLSKLLHASSEADSPGNNVFIGEVLTFRITFATPAGLLSEVILGDTLPSGLSYIPGTGRLARNFDTGLTSSENPGSVNSTASGTFVDLTDGTELVVNGQAVSLFLGNLINSDNDFSNETFVLEIQAVVDNAAGNNAGVNLVNEGTLAYQNSLGQTQNLTPITTSATVI